MTARIGRAARGVTAALAVTALLAAHVVAGDALGGLTSRVVNSTNYGASGTMLYSHSYTGGPCTSVPTGTITDAQAVTCPGSIYPATAAATKADAITANGTLPSSQVTQTAQAASCGAVQLANRITAANPLLARNGTNFGTSGPMTGSAGITLDGANPGDYESSTVRQAQPNPGLSLGSTYGLGIWFKTSSSSGGPLFGFGDSASNIAGTNDRILYMTASGRLGFIFNTGGSTTGLSGSGYNDGNWHFAYVTMQVTNILLGVVSTITLYVGGTQVATGGGLLAGLSSYNGYWHLGWSPAGNGNPQQYFAGSLSNFVVLNNGSAPANLAVATTQTSFDSNTSAATEHWRLNDTGTATALTASLPVILATSPCSYVDITWGFTNPLSCAAAPQSATAACTVATTKLSAFANNTPQTVSSAAPGGTQTSTITLSHDATYTGSALTNFLTGLMIYAPLTITMTAGSWSTAFTWTSSPGSIFLL